jgi:hypothetical protein
MFADFFSKQQLEERLAEYKAQKAAASTPASVAEEFKFDPSDFPFADRVYRIHFKNGLSGEYHGAVLKMQFPFDPREVERIEHAEEVGH